MSYVGRENAPYGVAFPAQFARSARHARPALPRAPGQIALANAHVSTGPIPFES